MQGRCPLFLPVAALLRSKLRQAVSGEETAFVPQACITASKTFKTDWRSEKASLLQGPCLEPERPSLTPPKRGRRATAEILWFVLQGPCLEEAAEKVPLKTGGWIKMLTICNY